MWLILGLVAIIATFINLYMYKTGKDYKFAMAMGLSFTALTLCAEHSLVSNWVKGGSVDSRSYGCIKMSDITGFIVFIYYPFSERWGFIN